MPLQTHSPTCSFPSRAYNKDIILSSCAQDTDTIYPKRASERADGRMVIMDITQKHQHRSLPTTIESSRVGVLLFGYGAKHAHSFGFPFSPSPPPQWTQGLLMMTFMRSIMSTRATFNCPINGGESRNTIVGCVYPVNRPASEILSSCHWDSRKDLLFVFFSSLWEI